MHPWNSAKAKVQLRLSVQRLRTLQQKKEAQAKAARRDVALILERGRIETARVKVENIINEDIHLELLELLELYCELLLARFGLLDQNSREPDPGVSEGVFSIIHAAPRTELKELHILRDILMHKFGREFSTAVMENRDGCVSDRVIRKLVTATPSAQLVEGYLVEIAKAYGINWSPPNQGSGDDGGNGPPEGGVKELQNAEVALVGDDKDQTITVDAINIPKLPDIPPTEDEGDEKEQEKDKIGKSVYSSAAGKIAKPSTPPSEYDFEALTRRFETLKKR